MTQIIPENQGREDTKKFPPLSFPSEAGEVKKMGFINLLIKAGETENCTEVKDAQDFGTRAKFQNQEEMLFFAKIYKALVSSFQGTKNLAELVLQSLANEENRQKLNAFLRDTKEINDEDITQLVQTLQAHKIQEKKDSGKIKFIPTTRTRISNLLTSKKPGTILKSLEEFQTIADKVSAGLSESEQMPFFTIYQALEKNRNNPEGQKKVLKLAGLLIDAITDPARKQAVVKDFADLNRAEIDLLIEEMTDIQPVTGTHRRPQSAGMIDPGQVKVMLDRAEREAPASSEVDPSPTKRVERPFIFDLTMKELRSRIPLLQLSPIKSGKEELIGILEQTLRLMEQIHKKENEIPKHRLSKGGSIAHDILKKICDISDRAQDPKFAHVHVPTSLERKLNILVALAENITIVEASDIQKIREKIENKCDRKILDSLETLLEEARKLNDSEKITTNVVAEETIGLILRTPPEKKTEEQGYFELAEYLLINVAGTLYDAKVTENALETYALQADQRKGNLIKPDAEKIRKINEGLRRLEKQVNTQKQHHPEEKAAENFNIERACHFASGLISRLLMTPPLQKPNSQLDRNFQRFMDYLGTAFRSMDFIPEAEERRATAKLLEQVNPDELIETNPTGISTMEGASSGQISDALNWLDDLAV